MLKATPATPYPRSLSARCKTFAKHTQQPSQFEFVFIVYPVKQ